MSARSVSVALFVMLTTVSCVRFDPPQGNLPGLVTFEALGTATADGTRSPGEWDKADCTQFAVKVPGGTVTGDICMMNDANNLYSLVSYSRTVVDPMLQFGLTFHTPGTNTPGSATVIDYYMIQGGTGGTFPFTDAFPQSGVTPRDVDQGGTSDGAGAISTSGGMHVYELAHPLDSADDAHDFSLKPGDSLWFCALVIVDTETTNFPLCSPGVTPGIFGRVNILSVPVGGTMYTPDFQGRVCAVVPDACAPSQTPERPPKPHPCVEKPALCEKPTFQEAGMFLYCTIKPCAVHDELPRNCMRKFPCPVPPGGGGGTPPFYHLTFTGLTNDWDVVLVDRGGGKVPHRVVPIEGGVVVSFQPDRRRHMPGLIGDYVAMFVMKESGRTGVRYDVKARLDMSDGHYRSPRR